MNFLSSQELNTDSRPSSGDVAQDHVSLASTADSDIADEDSNRQDGSLGGAEDQPGDSINELRLIGEGVIHVDGLNTTPVALRKAIDTVMDALSSHTADPSCAIAASAGPDPTKTIPLLYPDGSPVIGGDGKRVVRPDDGHDPQYFERAGHLAHSASGDAALAMLSLFGHAGPWDEQRVAGDIKVDDIDLRDVNYATIAIGLYGCAAKIPETKILQIEDTFASHFSHFGRVTMDSTYTHLPETNVKNTDIGYQLCRNHVFTDCK